MPTSQHSQRTRLPAITLLTLVVAQFAAPAFGEIEVEVLGVGEDVRANILAYLSFERYKSSDDLSPEFVERLQERSEREARVHLREVETAARRVGVPVHSRTSVHPAPYLGIIEAAEQGGCDVIFMASHGRRGLGSLLIGSETQRVLTHTKIPVIVYR